MSTGSIGSIGSSVFYKIFRFWEDFPGKGMKPGWRLETGGCRKSSFIHMDGQDRQDKKRGGLCLTKLKHSLEQGSWGAGEQVKERRMRCFAPLRRQGRPRYWKRQEAPSTGSGPSASLPTRSVDGPNPWLAPWFLGDQPVAPSAPGSVRDRPGESPGQARTLRPVAEGNCVAMRRGGKQLEAKDQSAGKRTRFGRSIRRAC